MVSEDKGKLRQADFSAALNMELSDGWVMTANNNDFDPAARGAHTHHIALINRLFATTFLHRKDFQITGTATVTSTGSPRPFHQRRSYDKNHWRHGRPPIPMSR